MAGETPRPGYTNRNNQTVLRSTNLPSLKLVLFERPGVAPRIKHLGVEVFEEGDVAAATERLEAAGIDHPIESETRCCHAIRNKVWVTEPEGLRWEWYRITDDTGAFFPAPAPPQTRREGTTSRRPSAARVLDLHSPRPERSPRPRWRGYSCTTSPTGRGRTPGLEPANRNSKRREGSARSHRRVGSAAGCDTRRLLGAATRPEGVV